MEITNAENGNVVITVNGVEITINPFRNNSQNDDFLIVHLTELDDGTCVCDRTNAEMAAAYPRVIGVASDVGTIPCAIAESDVALFQLLFADSSSDNIGSIENVRWIVENGIVTHEHVTKEFSNE